MPPSALLPILLAASLASADDSAAMADFLTTLTPPPSGWSSSRSYCTWKGIVCDTSGRVAIISLASQFLTGTLPLDLSSLSNLRSLYLQRNAISGPVPNLSSLVSLNEVNLNNNNFTSVPPSVFKGLTGLQNLSISNNPNLLPWLIPSDLADSPALATLQAASSNVLGLIPEFLGSLTGLQSLRLSYNNITGPIPSSFNGSGIQNLWLNNQQLGMDGRIDVLAGMTQLQEVWLHMNKFSGPIPDLSGCKSLTDIQLRANALTGIVPSSLTSLPSLVSVNLDSNKLQGPMPDNPRNIKLILGDSNSFCRNEPGPCDSQVMTMLEIGADLGYPLTLAESWTGNDACAGWTFVTCQGKNVTVVTLSKQGFSGTISPAFASLTSLRNLYLNDNNLTGSIPNSLTTLPQLQTLDVSNNNLSGSVPSFPPSVKLTTSGNPLIGKVLEDGSGSSGSVSGGLIAGVVIAVLVIASIILFVLYKFYFSKRGNMKRGRSRINEPGKQGRMNDGAIAGSMGRYGGISGELSSQVSGHRGDNGGLPAFDGGNIVIPINVLKEATDDFNEENRVGRGGFGVVYKGVMLDGTNVAVKRMKCSSMGDKGMTEFQAEINVLTRVRHRHLVALLGYCVNGNERMLVYEYMPQGSLTQRLFEWKELEYQPLSWKQRITVALDVARGVEYLHGLAQQSFIHRDLKPSNILLGDDLRAKVADFGLVKLAPEGKNSLETRLAGTFGYLAPEYATTGRVMTKVDVYAFGVVLMELLTGRKAVDDTLPDEMTHLVAWFRGIKKEDIPGALDPTLDNLEDETMESIHKVAELAGHCTSRKPNERPDMGHTVNIMAPLVEEWKPVTRAEEDSFGINMNMILPQALERWQTV